MIGIKSCQIAERLVRTGVNFQGVLVSLLCAVDLADILIDLAKQHVGRKIFGKFVARGFVLLDHAVGTVGGGVDVGQSKIAVHIIRIQSQDLLIAVLGTGPVILGNTEFGLGNV